MKKRPSRPTEEFLYNIGVFYLPDDVDITFNDDWGYFDRTRQEWVSPRAFYVDQIGQNADQYDRIVVPAFETPERTKRVIWNDLKNTLVTHFNAIAIEYGTSRDLQPVNRPCRPTGEFLSRVGLKRIPKDIDIVFRDLGPDCSRAFIIRKLADDGSTIFETEVPARETRANSKRLILEKVTRTLLELGADPQIDAMPRQTLRLF